MGIGHYSSFNPILENRQKQNSIQKPHKDSHDNKRRIIIVLLTISGISFIGLLLFISDHILTSRPRPELKDSMSVKDAVFFHTPKIGLTINDGVIYSGPDEDFAPVAQIEKGTRIQVLGIIQNSLEGDWVCIALLSDGRTGWVRKQLVGF